MSGGARLFELLKPRSHWRAVLVATLVLAGTVFEGPSSGAAAVPVEASTVVPQPAVSVWSYPSTPLLDGVGQWLIPMNEPPATSFQIPPSYGYSHTFWFEDLRATGTLSLGLAPTKYASFNLATPEGLRRDASIEYPWVAGRAYLLAARNIGAGQWRAWVVDGATGVWTHIGTLGAWPFPRAYPLGLTYAAWTGLPGGNCTHFPRAQVLFLQPVGYFGTQSRQATTTPTTPAVADCRSSNQWTPRWVIYGLGV